MSSTHHYHEMIFSIFFCQGSINIWKGKRCIYDLDISIEGVLRHKIEDSHCYAYMHIKQREKNYCRVIKPSGFCSWNRFLYLGTRYPGLHDSEFWLWWRWVNYKFSHKIYIESERRAPEYPFVAKYKWACTNMARYLWKKGGEVNIDSAPSTDCRYIIAYK